MATTGLFGVLGRSDDQDFNRAVTMSGMGPDQAVTFGRIRGAQAIGSGLSGPSDEDRAQRARDRIRVELMKLPQEQMSDPLKTYPVMIRVLQEEGLVEESLKLAAEFKTLERQDREQTRKEQKDATNAGFIAAKTRALQSGSVEELMSGYADVLTKLQDPTLDEAGRYQLNNMRRAYEAKLGVKEQNGIKVVPPGRYSNGGSFQQQADGSWQFVGQDGMRAAGGGGSGAGGGQGKLPAGYRWKADGSGEAEPIPGTAAATKAEGAAKKEDDASAAAVGIATEVADLVQRMMVHPGLSGAVGSIVAIGARKVPGSPEKTFVSLFDQLQGKLFLDGIKSMKGMGALSDAEGRKVAAAAAALDLDIEPRAFKAELARLHAALREKIAANGGQPPAPLSAAATAPQPARKPATAKTPSVSNW